jgi:hypothetical protein
MAWLQNQTQRGAFRGPLTAGSILVIQRPDATGLTAGAVKG